MTTAKVSHLKIAIRTFLTMALVVTIVCIINSWSNIKLSFQGNVPPLKTWLSESFSKGNILTVIVLSVYFYYRNWSNQKRIIERQTELEEQNRLWTEAQ